MPPCPQQSKSGSTCRGLFIARSKPCFCPKLVVFLGKQAFPTSQPPLRPSRQWLPGACCARPVHRHFGLGTYATGCIISATHMKTEPIRQLTQGDIFQTLGRISVYFSTLEAQLE